MLPPSSDKNLFHSTRSKHCTKDAIALHYFGLFTTALVSPNCKKCLVLQNKEMNINVDVMLHKRRGSNYDFFVQLVDIRFQKIEDTNNSGNEQPEPEVGYTYRSR